MSMEWRHRGNCGPETAEWFFVGGRPGRSGLSVENRAALELCAACPVIAECAADAQAHPEQDSRIAGGQVWRGTRRVRWVSFMAAHPEPEGLNHA